MKICCAARDIKRFSNIFEKYLKPGGKSIRDWIKFSISKSGSWSPMRGLNKDLLAVMDDIKVNEINTYLEGSLLVVDISVSGRI